MGLLLGIAVSAAPQSNNTSTVLQSCLQIRILSVVNVMAHEVLLCVNIVCLKLNDIKMFDKDN